MPGSLDRYIAALTAAALAAVAGLVVWTRAPTARELITIGILAATIAISDRIELSFRFEREKAKFSLAEAGVVIAILLVPPVSAALAGMFGAALAAMSRRLDRRRVVFNIAQVTLGTSAAAALVEVVPAIEPTVGDRSAVTALVGMILYSSVGASAITGVFQRLGDEAGVEAIRAQVVVTFGTAVGTTAVGIFFVHLWLDAPALLPFLAAPAAAVYLAGRGSLRSAELLQEVRTDRDRLTRVIDGASDGILLLDANGTIRVWNPAMERMTGIAADGAVGHAVAEILTRHVRIADDDEITGRWLIDEAHDQTAPRELTARLHHVDGTVRVVQESHGLVFDERGRCTGDVVLIRDVSRQEELERLRSDFVARVSHELRTPLTPIRGFASVLLRRADQLTDPQRREALENILDRADHLGEIVEDLLLVTRVDMGEARELVDVRPVDLTLVVKPLVQRTAARHPARAITYHQPPDVGEALADPARVRQIIEALLDNACRYSPPGTPIEVEVERAGDDVRIRVIDHGSGIPRDQREAIFERFHRLEDPMTMRTSGVGLGLFLARQLASAMHGRVELEEPRTSTGAVFILTLPAAEPVERVVTDAV